MGQAECCNTCTPARANLVHELGRSRSREWEGQEVYAISDCVEVREKEPMETAVVRSMSATRSRADCNGSQAPRAVESLFVPTHGDAILPPRGLEGTWSYSQGKHKYKLTVADANKMQYFFEERQADGRRAEALLKQDGEWYQGSVSLDDELWGHLRLRPQNGELISNFKTSSEEMWGDDCAASRDGLEGIWSYSQGRCTYHLTALGAHPTMYLFEEQRADGKTVEAILTKSGDCYLGSVSHGGKHLGHIRLRLQNGHLVRNFRRAREDAWGDDCIATTKDVSTAECNEADLSRTEFDSN
mmetsp:Transcript_9359/g.17090  ORF Transcript_9359/g.17090 Transcript_9359/m.17090 type:complete len:300 (+) Transcript_9359:22-921(+)